MHTLSFVYFSSFNFVSFAKEQRRVGRGGGGDFEEGERERDRPSARQSLTRPRSVDAGGFGFVSALPEGGSRRRGFSRRTGAGKHCASEPLSSVDSAVERLVSLGLAPVGLVGGGGG